MARPWDRSPLVWGMAGYVDGEFRGVDQSQLDRVPAGRQSSVPDQNAATVKHLVDGSSPSRGAILTRCLLLPFQGYPEQTRTSSLVVRLLDCHRHQSDEIHVHLPASARHPVHLLIWGGPSRVLWKCAASESDDSGPTLEHSVLDISRTDRPAAPGPRATDYALLFRLCLSGDRRYSGSPPDHCEQSVYNKRISLFSASYTSDRFFRTLLTGQFCMVHGGGRTCKWQLTTHLRRSGLEVPRSHRASQSGDHAFSLGTTVRTHPSHPPEAMKSSACAIPCSGWPTSARIWQSKPLPYSTANMLTYSPPSALCWTTNPCRRS